MHNDLLKVLKDYVHKASPLEVIDIARLLGEVRPDLGVTEEYIQLRAEMERERANSSAPWAISCYMSTLNEEELIYFCGKVFPDKSQSVIDRITLARILVIVVNLALFFMLIQLIPGLVTAVISLYLLFIGFSYMVCNDKELSDSSFFNIVIQTPRKKVESFIKWYEDTVEDKMFNTIHNGVSKVWKISR